VEWLGALPLAELRAHTLAADVCLGVFGGSDKAARVVPNRVYDALACGRPVVTAGTPGARELLHDGEDALLVPAADGPALAAALRRLVALHERDRLGAAALALYRRALTPPLIAGGLLAALETT
jgi:glycosyltransferase involved in cell wall biosynthesis